MKTVIEISPSGGGYMDSLPDARNVRGPRALKTPGIDSPQNLDILFKKKSFFFLVETKMK